MRVSLTDAGKRFNRDWIFRHFTYSFIEGISYAIVGPNGSGKSTLLQVLSGAMEASEGTIQYSDTARQHADPHSLPGTGHLSPVIQENVYKQVSICAPYLDVIEEMTLKEFLAFHQQFKPLLPSIGIDSIISIMGLKDAINKQIRYYSSGMKQRVKLAQAIFSDTPFLLLDEPCTNLDTAGIDLYNRLIEEYCQNRLIVVSSNDETEYRFCSEKINITDYKK